MSTIAKYFTFDFKANLEKIIKLTELNVDDTRPTTVNVISSVNLCGIWSYVVGVFNNDQETNSMIKQFKINLKETGICYKENEAVGIYNFSFVFDKN